MKINNSVWKKLALVVAGGIVLAFLLNNLPMVGGFFSFLWGLVFPFVLGFIIAFVLNIPMRFLEKKIFRGRGGKLRRPVSFILAVVLVLAVIALVLFLVVPQLIDTVSTLVKAMPGYIQNAQDFLEPYLEYIPAVQEWVDSLNIDWQGLITQITQFLQDGAGNLFSSAYNVATGLINGIVSLFIGLTFACYLLLDKEHLVAQFQGLLQAYIPAKRYKTITDVAGLTGHTYSRFISGQCIEAVIVTLMYLVVLSVGGFKYSLLISIVTGFFSLIPMIGALIGCVIGAFLLLVSMGFWRALVYVILFIVIQQIEGNLIYPHVVGSSVGLPPVWILVAVMVGGGLGGIFGMLFFIPLFSVIYALLHRDAANRLAKKGIDSPVSQLDRPPKKTRTRRGRRGKAAFGAEASAAKGGTSEDETHKNEGGAEGPPPPE